MRGSDSQQQQCPRRPGVETTTCSTGAASMGLSCPQAQQCLSAVYVCPMLTPEEVETAEHSKVARAPIRLPAGTARPGKGPQSCCAGTAGRGSQLQRQPLLDNRLQAFLHSAVASHQRLHRPVLHAAAQTLFYCDQEACLCTGETDSRWASTARLGCSRTSRRGLTGFRSRCTKPRLCRCAIASTISAVYSRVSASSKMPCSRGQPHLQRLYVLWTLLLADTKSTRSLGQSHLQCMSRLGTGLLQMLTAHAVGCERGMCHDSNQPATSFAADSHLSVQLEKEVATVDEIQQEVQLTVCLQQTQCHVTAADLSLLKKLFCTRLFEYSRWQACKLSLGSLAQEQP